MDQDFSGKVAVVTGGGSGIGEACARLLAARGAHVLVADRDLGGAERVAGDIGGAARAFEVDVADPQACEAMVRAAVEAFGRLDVAVNNAGIGGPQQPTGDYPLDGWASVIAVNLSGVFYCMRAELPAMLESGGGSIVNMASILGTVGFAQSVAYVAAKHGVVGMTKTAAVEYAQRGIRVNSVGPGFIDTPLLAAADPQILAGIGALHPIGRLGRAAEVAELVAFLASDRASNTTGSYLLSDGGYTAL
ncbi:SDR family NAD(P)-dependent oxidoreductase [Spirilliplanes yamanashiensis]|uniref:Oxidoreductase n=1 Tax=Spirilliplanes yamanashiensis TaxID=42233 RepID=A0A8J3YFD0_9ACTN|nr:SDR family NAD(P)-dependent oxidoreductase [Spirilliplanes yamanashiensis]MDP9818267.1 NAD(P)-dependent dehydrogenase (short-subunit alcohol dehydrogenase family) [Spirilliplanes yamanashiensis]GIJ06685.1 oxidoreductase [Spirilliplanes yamanashiensis]